MKETPQDQFKRLYDRVTSLMYPNPKPLTPREAAELSIALYDWLHREERNKKGLAPLEAL